jgi:hypothetical protein
MVMKLISDWKFDDMCKRGIITYDKGDEVIVFKRKSDGHPRSLKDDIIYTIYDVNVDGHLLVRFRQGTRWSQTIKIHKKYVISKTQLRDIKINEILN